MIWTRDHGLIETLAQSTPSVISWRRAALSESSPGLCSVLAYLSSGGRWLYPEVLDADASTLDPRGAVALAQVMALQHDADMKGALQLLGKIGEDRLPPSGVLLLAQLLMHMGQASACAALLARTSARIPRMDRAALEIDLAHPQRGGEHDDWWSAFRALFVEHGLEPPMLESPQEAGAGLPLFDLLRAEAEAARKDGPLVTVILTTFRPGRSLLTSTRSILAQSWLPLELIVVDDASEPKHAALLDEVEAMDERVRVLRRAENQGTYAARNAALQVARGEYVTGQDDDDWSHPRRLERQIEPLLDGSATATCTYAVRTDEHLRLVQPGRRTLGRLSPTYLASRRDILRAGGFLPARKGADAELIRRMEVVTDSPVHEVQEPLAIYRLGRESLSRSDFRPGWHHPARAAFWSSAKEVHGRIAAGQLSLPEGLDAIVAPARLGGRPGPEHFDVVFVADFSRGDLGRRGVVSELEATASEGSNVGVVHLNGGRGQSTAWTALEKRVQRMINDRTVHRVLLDEAVSVQDLVVLEPRTLQFPPLGNRRVRAERGWVIADHAPSDATLRRVSYVPSECTSAFEELFGVTPTWVARDHAIRKALAPTMREGMVSEQCLPHPVSIPARAVVRRPRPALGPVAGKVATTPADWPDDDGVLAAAYPPSGREMRVLGSTSHAIQRMHRQGLPAAWVVFEARDMSPSSFLRQIDAYVDFAGALSDGGWARSLALATGVPVVLPADLEPTYGQAALYAQAEDVDDLLWRIIEDRGCVAAQAEASRSFARERLNPGRGPWLAV